MIKKFALGILSLSLTVVAQAQIASDSASDATYQPPFTNWQNGDNGGFGFGAWSGLLDQYVGNSDVNGDGSNSQGSAPGVDIDTASQAPLTATGASWALRGNGGGQGEAFRGLPALQVGQTLRLDFDNGNVDTGSVGFGIRSGVTDRFDFFYSPGGNNTYKVAGSSVQETSQGFTDDGMRTYFTLTGANTYSFTVDWLGLGTGADETFTGTLQNTGTIDTVRLYNFSTNGDPGGNAFYNSLQVVPEPSTWLAGAMTLVGCFYLRRRRKA
jgi:hypothetical protein